MCCIPENIKVCLPTEVERAFNYDGTLDILSDGIWVSES